MAAKDLFSGFEPYKLTNIQLTDKKLGHGSYATVVELKYMGLKCAGKIIHEALLEQGDDSYIIRRFEEECRILSRVRHPNIVQFLGVYFKEREKVPILVMEFLPMNLTSCIEKHGILPEERSYSILHDVALGLCYLHSQEPPIIHRDLSANNVLLTENMNAKISDLGVARIHNLTPLQVTRMTQTPGTPAYMPPEVMVANPKYDTSIDTFSFGILTMHILSGQWPEPQCSQIRMEGGLMIPVSEAERRQDFLEVIGTDHKLMNLILKCIHNDPKERMRATDIVEKMSEMVSDQFSKQLSIDPVGENKGGVEKISGELVVQKSQLDKDKGATMREEGSLVETTDGTDSKLTCKSESDTLLNADTKADDVKVKTDSELSTCFTTNDYEVVAENVPKKPDYCLLSVIPEGKKEKTPSTTKDYEPTVELEEWYFGNIERALVVRKLKKDGDFLVRYSTKMRQYIISCLWKNQCQHYILKQNSSGEYITESDAFRSLKELIDLYLTQGKPVSKAGEILRNPVTNRDKWAIKFTDVEIVRNTGSITKFGEIFEGLDKRTNRKVMLTSYAGNTRESINSFLLEAEVLKQNVHYNVVRLIGVCVEPNLHIPNHPMYIVTEYTPGGTFLQFLKEKGDSEKKSKLCRMCIDISEGLNYIHTKLLRAHCDLAARSCLVDKYNVVKVSNLGLSMCFGDGSEYKQVDDKTQLAVRWTAPETFLHSQRYLLSDIWSFGVLLWETFSGGKTPYPGMDNVDVLSKVENGYHMDPPEGSSQEIKDIMLKCWNHDPKLRPSFTQLLDELKAAHLRLIAQGM